MKDRTLEILQHIDSVKGSTVCTSTKPDLISFYDKYSSSFNKAVLEVKIDNKGLKIINASSNIRSIMGYTNTELEGTYIEDYRTYPFNPSVLKRMIALLDNNEVINKRNLILHKNGNQVETRGILFKDGDKYIEFVWLADDEFDLG